MPNILDFTNEDPDDLRAKAFEKELAKLDPSDEAGKRQLEATLLQPSKVSHYNGPKAKPRGQTLAERSVKIVFANTETMEMLKRHFAVSKHVENSIAHPELFVSFLEKLESGEITYDKRTRQIDGCNCKGVPPVGSGQQGSHRKRRRKL